MLKVLDVDGAVRRVGGGWTATGNDWAYDADRYARVAEARRAEQNAMLEYIATGASRMEFLRRRPRCEAVWAVRQLRRHCGGRRCR